MRIRVNAKRLIIFALIIFTYNIFSMHYKSVVDAVNIKEEKEKYVSMLKEEQQKNEKLKEKEENLNTDESYEAIARDNLGLLKSSETLYINADAK